MSIKRYSGTGFTDVSSRKRWNGSAWVDLTIGKRWNGAAWVDLWSASSGSSGSSGASSGSGVLFSDLKSTVSSPTVHYSCEYEVTNSGVTLSLKGWLNSSASSLGNGIKLTVFARMNDGAWTSTVKAFRFALCERQGFRQDEDRALCDAFRVELFRFCRKHRLRQKAENFLFQFVITQ